MSEPTPNPHVELNNARNLPREGFFQRWLKRDVRPTLNPGTGTEPTPRLRVEVEFNNSAWLAGMEKAALASELMAAQLHLQSLIELSTKAPLRGILDTGKLESELRSVQAAVATLGK